MFSRPAIVRSVGQDATTIVEVHFAIPRPPFTRTATRTRRPPVRRRPPPPIRCGSAGTQSLVCGSWVASHPTQYDAGDAGRVPRTIAHPRQVTRPHPQGLIVCGVPAAEHPPLSMAQ